MPPPSSHQACGSSYGDVLLALAALATAVRALAALATAVRPLAALTDAVCPLDAPAAAVPTLAALALLVLALALAEEQALHIQGRHHHQGAQPVSRAHQRDGVSHRNGIVHGLVSCV